MLSSELVNQIFYKLTVVYQKLVSVWVFYRKRKLWNGWGDGQMQGPENQVKAKIRVFPRVTVVHSLQKYFEFVVSLLIHTLYMTLQLLSLRIEIYFTNHWNLGRLCDMPCSKAGQMMLCQFWAQTWRSQVFFLVLSCGNLSIHHVSKHGLAFLGSMWNR